MTDTKSEKGSAARLTEQLIRALPPMTTSGPRSKTPNTAQAESIKKNQALMDALQGVPSGQRPGGKLVEAIEEFLERDPQSIKRRERRKRLGMD